MYARPCRHLPTRVLIASTACPGWPDIGSYVELPQSTHYLFAFRSRQLEQDQKKQTSVYIPGSHMELVRLTS